MDEALDLLDAGHAAAVVELAEHCMKRLDTALGKLDDSGGYLGAPVDRLRWLHHAACFAARPDPRALGRRLADWALAAAATERWSIEGPVSRSLPRGPGRRRRRQSVSQKAASCRRRTASSCSAESG